MDSIKPKNDSLKEAYEILDGLILLRLEAKDLPENEVAILWLDAVISGVEQFIDELHLRLERLNSSARDVDFKPKKAA